MSEHGVFDNSFLGNMTATQVFAVNNEIYTITITANKSLLNDVAMAIIPDIIRSLAEQLRAKTAFVSPEAIKVGATAGSFDRLGNYHEELLQLREEVTREEV